MSEAPGGGLAAEADALSRERLCDGTDRHVLGWSGRVRAAVFVSGVGLVVVLVLTGQFPHFGAVAVGLLLGASLGAGMSTSVSGDRLVVNRFGYRRQVRLAEVRRVERYQYRSNVSLRLRNSAGERLATVPVSALGYRVSPAAARHLLRYLDRQDVVWEPGAWETLSGDQVSPAARAGEHILTVPKSGPRGMRVVGKPVSGWGKATLYLSGAALVAAVIFLLVLVPVTWHGYLESRRTQHGPEAMATLQAETVTASSDRYGTHHTTHFRVSFTTQTGEQVTTVVNAHGRYDELPAGYQFLVRYDPSSPKHAELPGAPDSSLSSAVLVTVIAAVATLSIGGFARRFIRIRRRGSSAGVRFGSSFAPDDLQPALDKLKDEMAGRTVEEIKPALRAIWKSSTGGGDLADPTLTTIARSIADGRRVVVDVRAET